MVELRLTSKYLPSLLGPTDGGHDSLEDSRACMELMLWKVKQDLKKLSRRSSTSETK